MSLSIRSDVEPIDPSLTTLFVLDINTQQYFVVAIAALLVYDTITTMDKEVKYFWNLKGAGKSVNIVYFANRYIGILGALTLISWSTYNANITLCRFAEWTRTIASWVTLILIDYILMIRVLALYSHDMKLSICLKAALALEALAKLGIIIYGVWFESIAIGGLVTGATFCGTDRIPRPTMGIIDWVISMVYGVILMALALYKAAEFWRLSAGFSGFNLVKVLIQDQLVYFLVVVSCCVFNIVQFKIKSTNVFWSDVLELLGSPSFLCVLGSRMLVNLKEAGERGANGGTSYRLKTMSNVEFA